jgi:hypothetical protein
MGIRCHLIQIPERKVMQLDDEAILGLFDETKCLGTSTRDELGRYEVEDEFCLPHEVADEPYLPIFELRPDGPRRPIGALSLGKGWSELSLFLTGKESGGTEAIDNSSPISQAILGGLEVGKPLHSMHPARCLWADEVSRVAEALSALSHDELRKRFYDRNGYTPEVFQQIMHPFSLEDELDALYASDDLHYAFGRLTEDLDRLTAYYRIAAVRGNAMLIGFL